jgi:ribosomal protein S18 acetylase RimI-like enzyme
VHVRPARADEVEPALRLILSPPGGATDAKGIVDFVAFANERGMGLSGLHVAERGAGKLVSAALPVVSPGRTMLLLLPTGGGRGADRATTQLLDAVCRHGVEQGVHLAQVLVDPADTATETLLADHGFARMAELYYLQQQVSAEPAATNPPPLPHRMRWVTYSTQTHEAFGRAILESYQQSLDCPALNGLREVDDIIAGHQASGTFLPDSWFLLYEEQAPLGVLLMGESPRSESIELVYLGLSPAARGRGLSELMMRQAAAVVARRGMSKMYLAVDSRNTPALKLYYRHGMQRVGSKLAMLKDLRDGAPASKTPS